MNGNQQPNEIFENIVMLLRVGRGNPSHQGSCFSGRNVGWTWGPLLPLSSLSETGHIRGVRVLAAICIKSCDCCVDASVLIIPTMSPVLLVAEPAIDVSKFSAEVSFHTSVFQSKF